MINQKKEKSSQTEMQLFAFLVKCEMWTWPPLILNPRLPFHLAPPK